MRVSYKKYQLDSASYQLHDSKEWTTSVSISIVSDPQGNFQSLTFHASNRFKTKEEADFHSINYGKEIIDGKHPNAKLDF